MSGIGCSATRAAAASRGAGSTRAARATQVGFCHILAASLSSLWLRDSHRAMGRGMHGVMALLHEKGHLPGRLDTILDNVGKVLAAHS
jgi:hypothetical protein